jgi:hypothetical protein
MAFNPFSYRVWCKKINWNIGQLVSEGAVHDGDSAWLFCDRGVYGYLNANCRLYGINSEELNDPDPIKRQKAQDSRAWLKGQIEGKQLFVTMPKLEKYGRPLVTCWLKAEDFGDNSKSINKASLDLGFSTPFMGELL